MILFDYSQVSINSILAEKDRLAKGDVEEKKKLIKHLILNAISVYRKKYKNYGDMVISCDGKNSWRKSIFPLYKVKRKDARSKSDLDWPLIYSVLESAKEDLRAHFPYRVISLDGCEGDDVIAVLSKKFHESEDIMIISSDKDFKQLQKYRGVRQYSPFHENELLVTPSELKSFMMEHIVKGDTGDSIPNILSPDDVFTLGVRQSPVTAKRLQSFIEFGRDACLNEFERKNFDRNLRLIDFECIPSEIEERIVASYNEQITGSKYAVMVYLSENRFGELLKYVDDF